MKLNTESGLIESDAKFLASPYCDSRPENTEISLLVIHCISLPPGEFGHEFVEQFFMGKLDSGIHPYFETIKTLRVSAHCYIKRNGDLIQFVPLHKRAWHAGKSSFNGVENCNDFSIGIELEGCEYMEYTTQQYNKLVELTKLIQAQYPNITKQNITGHEHIAPNRKTDPGQTFDWGKYYALIGD